MGLEIGKFGQISTELWPLLYVKISFFYGVPFYYLFLIYGYP